MKKQYFVSVGVITNDKGEILLTQRNNPHGSYSHMKWQLPGGTIEYGEHPKETLHREILEETGITIAVKNDHPKVFSHVFDGQEVQVVLFAFHAKHTGGQLDIRGDEHTMDAKWVNKDAIDFTNSLPLTKEIIEETYVI